MGGQYASNTSVETGASRAEIERTLMRYGARSFGYMTEDHAGVSRSAISFVAHDRQIRMIVRMPSRDEREFTHTPSTGRLRTPSAALAEWEKACRQKWRALALLVKALLEAVEAEISTFEEAFLAFTVVPGSGGMTVADKVLVEMENAIATGAPAQLSLTSGTGGSKR